VFKERLAAAWPRIARSAPWKRILSACILVCSVGLLGYRTFVSWNALKTYDWQVRYLGLIPSFALFILQWVVVTWGWQSIMTSLSKPLPFRKHIKIYGYTNMMRRIPAGVLWMVAGRAYAYKDQDISVRTSALSSFLEFVIVVLTALPICALTGWGLGLLSLALGIALALVALVLEIGMLHPTMLQWLFRVARHDSLRAQLTYRTTLTWAAIYTLIWLISGTGLFIIALLFVDLPLTSLPVTIGAWVLSSLVSYLTLLSPSGLGVKELSLTFLLGLFLAEPLPLAIAIAIRLIWTVYDLVVGVSTLLL
jgi:hypothetical protein